MGYRIPKEDQKALIKLGNISMLCDMLLSQDNESRDYALNILLQNTPSVGLFIARNIHYLNYIPVVRYNGYYIYSDTGRITQKVSKNPYFPKAFFKIKDFQRKINYIKKLKSLK